MWMRCHAMLSAAIKARFAAIAVTVARSEQNNLRRRPGLRMRKSAARDLLLRRGRNAFELRLVRQRAWMRFRSLTGNYGVKFETTALQPVIAMAPLPWRTPHQFRGLMEKFANTSAIGV